jgi:hypothetical protein
MTYCQSCPIYKSCDEPKEYKLTLKWCWYRECKLVSMPDNKEIITKNNKKKVNK